MFTNITPPYVCFKLSKRERVAEKRYRILKSCFKWNIERAYRMLYRYPKTYVPIAVKVIERADRKDIRRLLSILKRLLSSDKREVVIPLLKPRLQQSFTRRVRRIRWPAEELNKLRFVPARK